MRKHACCMIVYAQVLLYDTPGLVDQPGQGNPLERLRSAWSTAALADQLLLIVDAERQVSDSVATTIGLVCATHAVVIARL